MAEHSRTSTLLVLLSLRDSERAVAVAQPPAAASAVTQQRVTAAAGFKQQAEAPALLINKPSQVSAGAKALRGGYKQGCCATQAWSAPIMFCTAAAAAAAAAALMLGPE